MYNISIKARKHIKLDKNQVLKEEYSLTLKTFRKLNKADKKDDFLKRMPDTTKQEDLEHQSGDDNLDSPSL